MARRTETARVASVWLSPASSRSVLACSRRAALIERNACAVCWSVSSKTARPSASVVVRYSPRATNGSDGIDAPEEPRHGLTGCSREVQEESTVEESVGLLARGLGCEGAAVAGGSVQEVLGVAGCAHGTDRVRRAAGCPAHRIDDKSLEPGRFRERNKPTQGAFAVGGSRADEEAGGGFPLWRGSPPVNAFGQTGGTVAAGHGHLADEGVRERVQQPVPRRGQAQVGVNPFSGLGESPLKVASMRSPMSSPQVGRPDSGLPSVDSGEIELEKDALASVLGGRNPGRLAVAGQLDESARQIVDAVHLVEPGKAEDGIDLLHLVHRDDSANSGVKPRAALHLGDHEAAGVLLLREQCRLLE